MTQAQPVPREIRRLGTQALRILWDDGHQSDYLNRYLRDHCPCAACIGGSSRRSLPVLGKQGGDLHPLHIGVVGNYAISLQWSDGHDSGIFSYQTLRELCPCEPCQPVAVAAGDPPA